MACPVFIFDMSGVLLRFDLDALKAKISVASGLPLSEVNRTWRSEPYIRSETGRLSSREFYRGYAARIGLAWPYEQWVDEWARICSPYEPGMALFRLLRIRYPAYVLSNLAEYHKEAVSLAVPAFWEAASGSFLSFQMGLYKPDAEIYRAVCASIGASPGECYYVDDDEANARGAREVGMQAFHFCPAQMDALRGALRAYLDDAGLVGSLPPSAAS